MSLRSFVPAFAAVVLFACASTTTEVRPREKDAIAVTDPAQRIADAAIHDGPSRTDVRAHVVTTDTSGALVEVSWNERAPNDVEALDDANMHVVRRFVVRGEEIEAVAPKPWTVATTLVACLDGRSDLLASGAHEDCVRVPSGAHVEPTGEAIQVPVEGPIPVGIAHRVRLPGDSRLYWALTATCCGDDEPTLF